LTAARLTYAQLGAALGGISKQAVGKLAGKGMPVDSVEAARSWRLHHLDAGRAKAARLSMQTPATPPAIEPDDAPAPDDSSEYRADRARRERIRADREQLELDQLRARLVDKDEVARLRFTEFRALRDSLGNVGARIKDACAAEPDPLRCEALINDEVGVVLGAFADQVLTRGVTLDADDDEPD